MNSSFFKLDLKDVAKGLAVAVLAVVVGAIQQGLSAHGVNFGDYDWMGILDIAWKAGASYLVKNLLSTQDGKVLGLVG